MSQPPQRPAPSASIRDRDAETQRLHAEARRDANWKRWGPYLSERQWGTVREDYSFDGKAWSSFTHEQARSRTYRWGEDGLLGICDRQCRLCFALALHNGRDPILKERLYGLSGVEGNHAEDVKELYYYLAATPTSSYLKALYKYPHKPYPYQQLLDENRARNKRQPEFEILDSGAFDDGYFDVVAEYAKAAPNDILIRITVHNRSANAATLKLLPTLWFRNNWSWGRQGEGYGPRPNIDIEDGRFVCHHVSLGRFQLSINKSACGAAPELLLTDNETNRRKLYGDASSPHYTKDAFHAYVVDGEREAIKRGGTATKAAAYYTLHLAAHGSTHVELRLRQQQHCGAPAFGETFDALFQQRIREADAFYRQRIPQHLSAAQRQVSRQAYAGLLWSKQFYYYVVKEWLEGDPTQPTPPPQRRRGRNHQWPQLYNRDVISMPDKWEYPWYAAWDLAFHMLPMARIDPTFAKRQLILFLREWYMHPNGQIPAYEYALNDVNPPVHAWAVWHLYNHTGGAGQRDIAFLARCFHKLLLNFTWWVNRTDTDGNNLFSGGFLGLDNIGVFDRSKPLPGGGHLEQADGTAWMAAYCGTMLAIALELARHDPVYEDVASKFLEHFVAIADAMHSVGGSGLWDECDGFYYDQLHSGETSVFLRIRSMVGLIALNACVTLEEEDIKRLPGFYKRMRWFMHHRRDLGQHISYMKRASGQRHHLLLLAIPSRERLVKVLKYVLDEEEFLSPYGVRSLSRHHWQQPFVFRAAGVEHRVAYTPGESDSYMFGGNSNWRGPIWFPVNYLLIEALRRYHQFYGDSLKVECPTGSGQQLTLGEVARELSRRLSRLFMPDAAGQRPCHGERTCYRDDPHYRDLVLFYEYFHGDDGHGLGASHQTGWTALVANCIEIAAGSD